MPYLRPIALALTAALLAGCSGGGTAEDVSPFTGLSQAILGAQPSGTARMRGTALVYTSGRAERLEGDGTLDLDTGAAEYSDGTYTLIDPDGFNSDGLLTDGTVTIAALDVPAGFTRVRPYIRPAAAGADWSAGVIGFRSKAARIATTGNATYTGPATLFSLSGAGQAPSSPASPANAALYVDFGAASLDLAITGVDPALTGGPTQILFDNMEIVGAQFRGGTLALTGGAITNPATLGALGRSNARGQFFGNTDAAGHPDEAGGALFVAGEAATLMGVFVAD